MEHFRDVPRHTLLLTSTDATAEVSRDWIDTQLKFSQSPDRIGVELLTEAALPCPLTPASRSAVVRLPSHQLCDGVSYSTGTPIPSNSSFNVAAPRLSLSRTQLM
jgi:hypothetical protein